MIVGATHRGGGGGELTLILAEAVPPVPPSTEVTGPVVLSFVPAEVAVTVTLNAHQALPASVAPVKLTAPEPAVVPMAPPPQLPVSPLGVETARPSGSASVKPTPVKVSDLLGLLMLKLSEVDSFTAMVTAPKDFAIVGGATIVTLAEAVPPVPPSFEVTAPVVLFFVPAVVPVTLTLKVHESLDTSVALARLMLPDPAVATMVPMVLDVLAQLPVSPFGVETTRPAGSESVKPTPLNVVSELGFLIVKLSKVDPLSGMLAAPKDFAIVGGSAHAPQDSKQSDASMQPRRMRPSFMNGSILTLVRRSVSL